MVSDAPRNDSRLLLIQQLSDLQKRLKKGDMVGYWTEAMRLLQAEAHIGHLSLWLFASHGATDEILLQMGQIPEGWQQRVTRWESSLRSHLREAYQPTDVDDIEIGQGAGQGAGKGLGAGEAPIVHMRLRIDGILLGGLSMHFEPEHRPPTDGFGFLADLVHLFCEIGLKHRYLSITRRSLEMITLIAQVSQSLNSSLNLETVLQETTEMSALTLQAQAATLFAVDSRTSELVFFMPTGSAGGVLREMRIPQSQGIAGWVASHQQSIIVNDAPNDPRFAAHVDVETGFHTRNILCVPLSVQGRLVGVLEVLNKEGEKGFTEEDKNWLEKLGNQASIALENARLYQNLRMEQERIIKAQEEVRHQLARDLHDGAAQMLSLIIMNVDVARRMLTKERYETVLSELDLLEDLARQANREIRTMLFELRPIILESRGLIPALRAYHTQLQSTMSAQMHLLAEDLPFTLVDQATNNIFSVVQESINNIRKHAKAENVWLRIWVEGQTLYVEVEDDGRGFNLNATQQNYDDRGSFGLLNMHERMEMIGGKLNIQSPSPSTGLGTLIQARVPLPKVRKQPA